MHFRLLTTLFALSLMSCGGGGGGGGSQPQQSIQVSEPTPSIIGQDNRLLLTVDVPYICYTGFVDYGDNWTWIFKPDGTISDDQSINVGTWQDIDGDQYWLQTDREPWLILERHRRTFALNHTYDSETGEGGERYGTCRRDL